MALPDAAREVVETELRRLGACSPCVLRFLGTPAADAGAYRDACARDAAAASSSGDQATCPCCLGVLQFDPDPAKVDASDEDGQAPRVDVDGGGGGGGPPSGPSSAREDDDVPPRRSPRLASHYAAGMRSAGHEITAFALEVTLPPSIPMRQAAARALLIEALRGAAAHPEGVFRSPPATTELRDAFRATLIPALESAVENAANVPKQVQHDPDAPFKFALLFEHEQSNAEAGFATRTAEARGNRDPRNRKRRAPPFQLRLAALPDSPAATWQRVGEAYDISAKRAGDAFTTVASFEADEHASCAMAAVRGGGEKRGDDFSRGEKNKQGEPSAHRTARATCRLVPWHQPCYLGGRYLKWKRGVPQSPWFADGGVVGEGSVQTSLETFALAAFKSRGCRLNSAGREDMDVRMLGGGRPFILEVHDPRRPAAFADVAERRAMEAALANADDGAVTATNIHPVPREAYITMHEGSAEKRKTYSAVCWASRALTEADVKALAARASGLTVQQKTPTRVLHRRTSATRPRMIHDAKASLVAGAPRFFLLELDTQAGTYIKEFVHGDFGRTSPSVGEILGCEADILQLDVTDIEMAFGGDEARTPGEEEQ
jgi:tRNA pseudouridine synthase 10